MGLSLMSSITKYKNKTGVSRIEVKFSKDAMEILNIDLDRNIINYNMKKIFEYCHDDKEC